MAATFARLNGVQRGMSTNYYHIIRIVNEMNAIKLDQAEPSQTVMYEREREYVIMLSYQYHL